MPIPAFTPEGLLPPGVHDCTLDELRERFGSFQASDRRCRLFERLEAFVREARLTGMVDAIIVDGSFVTDKSYPNDIDLILVLQDEHDYRANLRPFEYNVLSRKSVRRIYDFDVMLMQQHELESAENFLFFSQVRDRPDLRKGMIRVAL